MGTTTILSSILAVFMALAVIFIRMKAAKKPATARKIILPPIFMSTGALMFLIPQFQVSWLQVLEALAVGAIFSVLLIKTSKFEIKGQDIFLKRSKAFVFILLGLLVLRIVLKLVLSTQIDFGELTGMFWLLAFGMIVPWRIAMYMQYKKLASHLSNPDF
ncbi:MAG: cytochrome c biogenesis protein CcdC, partial [Bacillaceae bacterium]|nr:cytochrome c biogenesis protein CcdC [Bacillaceae bacterium]